MKKALPSVLAALAGLAMSWPALAGTVSGRLLDPSGHPVAGAPVRWYAHRSDDEILLDLTSGAEPAAMGETKTGEDGRFRVALEKPGVSIGLRILPVNFASIRLGGPFDSSEDTSLDDLHASAAEPATGRVLDEQGRPVANALVRAITSDPFSDHDAQAIGDARTGPDGAFTIAAAPAGPRALSLRVTGFVPLMQIQLDGRAAARLTLRKGGTIRGHVLDGAGKPVAGALVVCDEVAAMTDAVGAYRLDGVDTGVRAVEALYKENFAARKDALRVQRGAETEASLKLLPASAIGGTVVDETTRKPVAGVRLSASSGGAMFGGRRRRVERTARSDAQGKFRLPGLAPRVYTVSATRDGYLTSSINGITAARPVSGTANLALAKAASIAGRVVDEQGAAMAGARVRLGRDAGIRSMMRRGPAAFLGGESALSGPDGAFRIRGLPAGKNLILESEKAGYTTARRLGVTVKTGETLANVSLVMKKGLEASGRVADSQGRPVAGAEIRVARRDPTQGPGGGIRFLIRGMAGTDRPDATTGPDGGFVVRGLEPGDYSAAVSRDGYARKSSAGLPVKADGANVWPPIVLANGVALGGFVKDSQGQGISGAQIFAISPGDGARPIDTSTDPEGRFRVDGLAPNKQILLSVSAEGYGPAQRPAVPPSEDVAIVLKTAGTVRGRVEDGDAKQPITDFTVGRSGGAGGRGGGGIAINVAGRGGPNADRSFQSADGTFELPDVPPGKWTIRATAAGYRAGEASGVEVAEGGVKEGLVISLHKGGSISGRVLDPTRGTGVPNASVSWQSAGDAGALGGGFFGRMGGGGATSTSTDADGRFRFDGLPVGKVTITADHPDFLEASRDFDPDKDSSADITLGTGGSISGTAVLRDGRTPAAGALVSLNLEGDASAAAGNDSTRTDGSGSFSFDHLQAGRFRLSAQTSSGKSEVKEIILADGQRQDGVLLGMNPAGARIVGTVSGVPAAQLGGIRIVSSGGDYSDATQTDDSGNFVLHDVPPGVVRLNASTSRLSGRTTSKTIEVPDGGGDVAASIVFDGTSRLAGRVTRSNQPLAGLFVSANPDPPQASGGRASGQTDDNGQYALDGLVDGTYVVTLGGQGVSYHTSFTVSGDTAGDIAVPAVTLSGTVTEDGTGAPVEGAAIQAETGKEAAAYALKNATSDSSGHFEIDGIDPGSYQVTARKTGYELQTQSASVGSDPAQVSFTLKKGNGLTIVASDGMTGMPMHGLNALAFSGSGSVAFQGSVSLDATGKGEISSLAPGSYSIYLFSDGYAPRCLPSVTVPAAPASVVLTPGGRAEVHTAVAFTGQIADGSGAVYLLSPFRLDGRVSVVPPASSWDHLAPGSYRLVGSGRSYAFTITEGQTTRVDAN